MKILTYDGVSIYDRHDLKMTVHVYLLPHFKFNQDKKVVLVDVSDSF